MQCHDTLLSLSMPFGRSTVMCVVHHVPNDDISDAHPWPYHHCTAWVAVHMGPSAIAPTSMIACHCALDRMTCVYARRALVHYAMTT